MAIDPSIIGNVMVPRAPQMPDVNAMMQTRTAGMENVYKIERQRAEDAKAAQQAQADEAVKALIPAYAYALGNPADLTGALELAPPELRGTLEPYIAQLQGQPPEQVQAALIGSLSSSEVGRAFLETQGRMQTAEIQRGQLDVSRQREAREAAAAGRPNPMSEYEAERIKIEREKAARETAAVEAPKIKSDKARSKVDETLSEMLLSYNKLKQEGAIVSTEASGLENVIARTGAALGTTAGRAVGTKAQTERDYIQSLRMDLIRDIKAATGMSAQELNSNFELQAALDALSDPYGQSFETALRTIAKISQSYGKGGAVSSEQTPPPASAPAGAGGELRRYDSTGKRIQ